VGKPGTQCSTENTIEFEAHAIKAFSIMNRLGSSRLMMGEGDRQVGGIALKDMRESLSLKVELEK
jgi:hypothetical protein